MKMAFTIHEKKYMKFVSNQLNLPVFLVSRNRIKSNLTPLRGYIRRKGSRYTKRCNEENANETATFKKYKHIFDLGQEPPAKYCPSRPILKYSRELGRKSSWLLAPNMYNVPNIPFADWKGIGSALWNKPHTSQPLKKDRPAPQWKFYDINKIEHCNRYKGIFNSNARNHKPAARSMISNLQCCYRNPKDPAPNAYFPQNYTLANKVSPPIISKPPNPHIFLRRSSVPAKPSYVDKPQSKFAPGPGRYETRYINYCPCTCRLVFLPNLQLIIDRQKRLKFRRLPYMKIRARHYCEPDWLHVEGHGHRFLFKLPQIKKNEQKIKEKQREARRSKDTNKIDAKDAKKPGPKLYADARYLSMINEPNRSELSFWSKPLEARNPKIFFNCLQRYTRKGKVSAVNKKIAFNSGQERFHLVERPTVLTVSKLQKLIESLPLERQLRDQPVMKKQPDEIKPKLTAVPKYMQLDYQLELRKRLFKFLPLPGTKMLVKESECEFQTGMKHFDKTLETSSFLKEKRSSSRA